MAMMRKLATLATAAEAARRYAKKNPDQAGKYLDKAAAFIDTQTKGKFSAKITDATRKVKGVAGIPDTPAAGPTVNGQIAPPTKPSPTPHTAS